MRHAAGVGSWMWRYKVAATDNRLLSTSLPGDGLAASYSATYGYDAHGSMTSMPHLPSMGWDHHDQMQQVDLGGGGYRPGSGVTKQTGSLGTTWETGSLGDACRRAAAMEERRCPGKRHVLCGYEGNKTAFYALVAGARPPHATPIVRFEGLPGEFSQHDFGHVDVTFVDGRKKRIHFFASRLKYSRFVAVSIVANERVETLVRGLARHFVAFGGLSLLAVFDRPRTIVTKSGKGRAVETFNATFAQAIIDIGVGVEMFAARSGNQKGAVERLVGWVKGSFFKPRKFQDDRDLEAQLTAWLVEANTRTPSRATGVIPETKRQEELPRLRPVKVFPETLALRFSIVVGPTAEVHFEGVPYSMSTGLRIRAFSVKTASVPQISAPTENMLSS